MDDQVRSATNAETADAGDTPGNQGETTPPVEVGDRPPASDEHSADAPEPDHARIEGEHRAVIRAEIADALAVMERDPRDFDFKVATVKWFGILCGVALLLILAANAFFINQLFETGRVHESAIKFQALLETPTAGDRLMELAVENEALNMRNNRSVSALFMRAYTQFLSITAGMILAMLGAIFVLARVDSRETSAEARWKDFRWLINTSSPGVLLACLGVALVAFVAYRSITAIDTRDSPVFTASSQLAAAAGVSDVMATDEFRERKRRDLEGLGADK